MNCKENLKITNWGTKKGLCILCARKAMIEEKEAQRQQTETDELSKRLIEQERKAQLELEREKLETQQAEITKSIENIKKSYETVISQNKYNEQIVQLEYQRKVNLMKKQQVKEEQKLQSDQLQMQLYQQYTEDQYQFQLQQLQQQYQIKYDQTKQQGLADENTIKQELQKSQNELQTVYSLIYQNTQQLQSSPPTSSFPPHPPSPQQQQSSNDLAFSSWSSTPLSSPTSSSCSTQSASFAEPEFYRNNFANSSAQIPTFLMNNIRKCRVCDRELGKDSVQCYRCRVYIYLLPFYHYYRKHLIKNVLIQFN